MTHLPLILAAAQGATTRVLLLVGLLIVVVVAGGLLILALRRRLLRGESSDGEAGGLMDNLREMVRKGQISEEEFRLARRTLADRIAGRSAAGPGSPAQRTNDAARTRNRPAGPEPRP